MNSKIINNSDSVILRGRLIGKKQSNKGLESNHQVMYDIGKWYKPGKGQDCFVLNQPENYDSSILHMTPQRKENSGLGASPTSLNYCY